MAPGFGFPGKAPIYFSQVMDLSYRQFPGHNFKNCTLICRVSYVSASVWSSLSLAISLLEVAIVSNNVHSVQPKLYGEGLFFIVDQV
jgi:hypothetical protein